MLFVLSLARLIFQIQMLLAPVHLLAATMKDALQVQREELPAIVPTVFGVVRLVARALRFILRSVQTIRLPLMVLVWDTLRVASIMSVSQHVFWNRLLPLFDAD